MNILCIATLSSCWDLHAKQELTLLSALRERGHSIDYVICDGLGTICEAEVNTYPLPSTRCYFCYQASKSRAKKRGFKPRLLRGIRRFIDRYKARSFVKQIKSADLNKAQYHSYRLGEWVNSSILTTFRLSEYKYGNLHIDSAYRQYVENALCEAWAVERHLNIKQYDRLILFNGRIAYTKIVLELARQRGIAVYVHERGNSKEFLGLALNEIVSNFDLHRRFWTDWKNVPLTRSELEEVTLYLQQREHGDAAAINWAALGTPPGRTRKLRHDLGIEQNKRIWALFTSSTDELKLTPGFDAMGFKSQYHWLEHAISTASNYPDVHLVVRAHPNICGNMGAPSAYTELEYFYQLKNNSRGSITIVEPHEALSSYDLMNIAEVGIVYLSSCGLEMAARGKPVCIACTAYYDGIDAIDKAFSPILLEDILAKYAALPSGYRDTHLQRMTFRFWHTHIFKKTFHFPFVCMPDVVVGEYAYNSDLDLAEGNNVVLDHLCSIIEKGSRPQVQPTADMKDQALDAENEFLNTYLTVDMDTPFSEDGREQQSLSLPFVSIVMHVERGGQCLHRALAAIKAQSYPTDNFEILLLYSDGIDKKEVICNTQEFGSSILHLEYKSISDIKICDILQKTCGTLLYSCDDALLANSNLLEILVKSFANDSRVGTAVSKVKPTSSTLSCNWQQALPILLKNTCIDLGDLSVLSENIFPLLPSYRLTQRSILKHIASRYPTVLWLDVYKNGAYCSNAMRELGVRPIYTARTNAFYTLPRFLTARFFLEAMFVKGKRDIVAVSLSKKRTLANLFLNTCAIIQIMLISIKCILHKNVSSWNVGLIQTSYILGNCYGLVKNFIPKGINIR